MNTNSEPSMSSRSLIGVFVVALAAVSALASDEAGRSIAVFMQSDGEVARALRKSAALAPPAYTGMDLPWHFRTAGARRFTNEPETNRTTDAGASLGRFLFYDTRLSRDGTLSCGSCHDQSKGFTDPNRFSRGFEGRSTERKSMNLVNVGFQPGNRFFWDERVEGLEEAVLDPIQNHVELGNSLEAVVATIGADDSYAPLFEATFGDPSVDAQRIGKALAQFIRSLVSYRSRYDEGMVQVHDVREDFPNFTAEENRGKAIFMQNCKGCHMRFQDAHFHVLDPLNNGLDADPLEKDGGVGDVTLRERDIGRFKSPGLRNVEVTGPYMHDGRFSTLEEVVNHYSDAIVAHPNLGNEGLRRLDLDREQKAALVAFLRTLTDSRFLTDPKFSNPYATHAAPPIASAEHAEIPRDAIERWLVARDTNQDGSLDRSELEGLHETFVAEGLTRGDRRLNFGMELIRGNQHQTGAHLTAHGYFVERTLATFDRDGDGVIERPEVEGAPQLLPLGDRNGDGGIDAGERALLVERFQTEFVPTWLQSAFTRAVLDRTELGPVLRADSDHDGAIAAAERSAAIMDVASKADGNGDGVVDRDELDRAKRRAVIDAIIAAVPGTPLSEGLQPNRVHDALASMRLPEHVNEALAVLFESRQRERARAQAARAEALANVRAVLGEAEYAEFEAAMTREDRPRTRQGPTVDDVYVELDAAGLATALLAQLDADGSGALERGESRQLAVRLAALPGGFDPERPAVAVNERLDLEAVIANVLKFDADGDGKVAKAEIPERLDRTFARYDISKDGILDPEEVRSELERDRRDARLARLRLGAVAPERITLKGIFGNRPRGLDRAEVEAALHEIGASPEAIASIRTTVSFEPELAPGVLSPPSQRHELMAEIGGILGPADYEVFLELIANQPFTPAPIEPPGN